MYFGRQGFREKKFSCPQNLQLPIQKTFILVECINKIVISKLSILWADVHMATTEVTSCYKQRANDASSV